MYMSLMERSTLFVRNMDIVSKAFPFSGSLIHSVGSFILSDRGVEANREELRKYRQTIQQRVGLFSNFRGDCETVFPAYLCLSEHPKQLLEDALECYSIFKEHFIGSAYLPYAAIYMAMMVPREQWLSKAQLTSRIYGARKDKHPLITSAEDVVTSFLMTFSDKSIDQMIQEEEMVYASFNDVMFMGKNALQLLSFILVLSEGPILEKCDKVRTIERMLKEKTNASFNMTSGVAVLGGLASLPLDNEEIVDNIAEVFEFLEVQKGYGGFFGISKKVRLLHASTLAIGDALNSDSDNLLSSALLLATLEIIISQRAAASAAA